MSLSKERVDSYHGFIYHEKDVKEAVKELKEAIPNEYLEGKPDVDDTCNWFQAHKIIDRIFGDKLSGSRGE